MKKERKPLKRIKKGKLTIDEWSFPGTEDKVDEALAGFETEIEKIIEKARGKVIQAATKVAGEALRYCWEERAFADFRGSMLVVELPLADELEGPIWELDLDFATDGLIMAIEDDEGDDGNIEAGAKVRDEFRRLADLIDTAIRKKTAAF